MAPKNALRHIASKVLATIGAEFFESLVKNLAEALEADCIYVGEFVGGKMERVRTVASWVNGKPGGGFERYTLAGSVAAQVAVGENSVYTRYVLKKFPSDVLLLEMDAQACVAVPLLDPQRQASGALMAVYRRALANARLPKSMLEMFAPRAAAELGRQQGEAALRESEQRYRMFVARNPDAMWRIEFEFPIPLELSEDEQIEGIFDQGYLAECNDAAARLHGYEKADQVIGRSLQEWAGRGDPRLRERMRSAVRSGYGFNTVQREMLGPDGTQRLRLQSYWGIIENGTLTRIWGTTRDITELLRQQGALDATQAHLAELLESLHLVTVMLDNEGAVTFCNNYLLRLTGWVATEVSGKNWFDLMVPPEERDKLREAFAATRAKSPSPYHFESTLLAKDGRRLLVAWESTPLRNSEGQVTGIAGLGRDVTASGPPGL